MDVTGLMLFGWGACVLFIGYFIAFVKNKAAARALAWAVILLTTVFSITTSAGEPPLYRMVAIASLQLIAMKSIVLVESYPGRPHRRSGLSFIQWAVFVNFRNTTASISPALLPKQSTVIFISFSRICVGISRSPSGV